jgi:hypothetical protein
MLFFQNFEDIDFITRSTAAGQRKQHGNSENYTYDPFNGTRLLSVERMIINLEFRVKTKRYNKSF